MSTRTIVGFFKNFKSYFAAIWEKISHWKDARRPLAIRFAKLRDKFIYKNGKLVGKEPRFRAVATFETHDGRVISRQCSSKGWPLYSYEETAPHTKYFRVIGLEGSKSSKASDYFTCLEGCGCPAYRHKSGLIDGFCKHQLMLADEIGINNIEEEEEETTPQVSNTPIKDDEEVDLNKFSKASINFGAIKPKQPQIQKSPPGTLRVVEKGDLYGFFNITTAKFEEENIFWEEIQHKAVFYERKGHKIEGLFHGKYWYFYENRGWIEFKQFQKEVAEAREMLGLGLR